jgi:hypothetical protein
MMAIVDDEIARGLDPARRDVMQRRFDSRHPASR